jgi:Zn-dependent peptidase ImmA (M78 family)
MRAKHESLRHLAAEYGVSHEAIRRIVNLKSTKTPVSQRRSA